MTTQKSSAGQDRRHRPRVPAAVMAIATVDGSRVPVQLHDISASGARLGPIADANAGALVRLELPGIGTVLATVVRASDRAVAVSFPADPAIRALFDDPESVFERIRNHARAVEPK